MKRALVKPFAALNVTLTFGLSGSQIAKVVAADASTEVAGVWVKDPKNPVLGGDLDTCFDISVRKEGDTYRMWLSWRP